MARLQPALIARLDSFADRVLDVAIASRRNGCPGFVRDQMSRAGTSVGSNTCEANEALTVPEFVHRLGTALKELGETKYWLRMTARRNWVNPSRLAPLIDEADQLTRIFNAIIMNTKKRQYQADQPRSVFSSGSPLPEIDRSSNNAS